MSVKWKQFLSGASTVGLLLCLMMTSAFAENPATTSAATAATTAAATPEENAATEPATPATQSAPALTTQGDTVTDPVAKIGEVPYATLADAVAAAKDGNTITLQKDATENVLLNKSVTLNLNKHTLMTSDNGTGVSEATVTIENGTVTNVGTEKAGTPANDTALSIYPGGKLTIAKETTVRGSWIGITSNPVDMACDDASLTVFGTVEGLVDANNGYGGGTGIVSSDNTITGSGLSVTIKDGAKVTGAHGTDPTSTTDADGQGIAMNGRCTVAIEGGTISGDEAIGQKAGNLVVNGGTLNGTGSYYDPPDANNSGSESTGAAISVTNTYVGSKNGTKATLTITGGTITSANGCALYEGKSKDHTSLDALLDSISITGGTFKGGKDAVVSTMSKFIAGGTFSSDPTTYGCLADNEVAVKDGDVFNVVSAITVVDTAPTVADAKVELSGGQTEEQTKAAEAAATQLASSSADLGAVAESTAAKVTTEDVQAQATKLSTQGVTIDDTTTVTVFVQPSIVVKVTDATVVGNKTTALKLDVTAYVQKIATTATDPADIKTDGTGKNAVLVSDSVTPLEPTGNVILTLPLASDFAVSEKLDNVAVKHEKESGDTYYYKANVTGDAAKGYVATVEDTHGFSPMTIFSTSDQKATITYNNDGTDVTIKEYTIQDVFDGKTLPSAGDLGITKEGYTLKGWKLDGSDTLYTTMTGNLWTALEGDKFAAKMSAVWEANTYTVTFDANGGTGTMEQQKGTCEDETTLHANEFKNEPHNFTGWFDKDGNTYVPRQTITLSKDITLYALWDHYVTFDPNDGSGKTIVQHVVNSARAMEFQNPTRTGYTFKEWNTKSDGSGTKFTFDKVFTSTDGDPTYYAVWDPIPYKIAVYNHATTGVDPITTISADYGVPTKLPAADLFSVPDGMAGYKLAYITDGNGHNYNPGQEVTSLSSESGAVVTLHGEWVDPKSVAVISYNANGAKGTMANQAITGTQNLTANSFTKAGYRFIGWKSDGTLETPFADSASVTASGLIENKTTTLTAQWTQNTGTVELYANEGSGESSLDSLAVPTKLGVFLPIPADYSLSRTGYTLQDKWNDQADGNGSFYASGEDGDLFNDVLIAKDGGTTKLYAQWMPVTWNVNFIANGGDGDMTSQVVTYGTGTQPLRDNEFTRAGYVFNGWYKEAACTTPISSVENLTADENVYAGWTKSYMVSFDLDAGTGTGDYNEQTVRSGALVTEPAYNPTKAGYTFGGWYYNDGGGNVQEFNFKNALDDGTVKDSSNLEITAKWDPITYTVNFISNYGAGYTGATGTQTFKYGEAQALANPTKFAKPGYKQASWNTKADGQGTTYQLGQSVNNLTTTAGATINLRAIWVVNDTYKVAYDLDGGTLRSDIANPKTGVSWTDGNLLPSVNPTKAGHAFAGWVNKDGSGVNSATVFNTLPECYTDNTKKTAQEPANGAATLTATWIPYTEAPVITTGADLGTATLGVAYSKMFAFAGVPDTGTWSVASGSVPDGLAFDPATAKLSGTPTKVGTYAFELKVDNGTGSTTKRFTLKVAAKTTITTKDIEPGLVDSAYSQQLDATGENVTWSVADGDLPDGITLAADGTLSGTPTEAGSFVFAVTATSATTGYATRIYQLDVYQAPIITTKTIPDMVVGTAVSQQLEATAEPADVSWAITGGSMPTGLKLSEDGLLSGTPTTAGTYTFTVAADNDTGTPGTKSYTVKVQTSAEALYEDDVLGVGGAGAVYTIKSGANTENAVDISAASKDDGANAQVWSDNETPAQRFLVQYHAVQGGKGYYTFKNVSSGKVLDVNGASSESGANVQQYSSNGTVAQQWVLSDLGNGFRKITNAGSGKVLDVSGGSKSSGANLQQYDPNGTAAQAFRLDACKTASEGTFSIVAALAGAPVLDVSGGSNDTCANIQIWTPNGTKAQSFTLAYDATNGYYSITNTGSGKLVDVCGAGSDPGTNVWQYPANGTLAQKWSIVKVASGSYELYSACDGLALDVTGAGSAAGTNVQVFTPNHTVAQSWTLRPIA